MNKEHSGEAFRLSPGPWFLFFLILAIVSPLILLALSEAMRGVREGTMVLLLLLAVIVCSIPISLDSARRNCLLSTGTHLLLRQKGQLRRIPWTDVRHCHFSVPGQFAIMLVYRYEGQSSSVNCLATRKNRAHIQEKLDAYGIPHGK